MPLPVESTAVALKQPIWPQLSMLRHFVEHPLVLMSIFSRIELRLPDTALIVRVPEAAPDLAVTVAVVDVVRLTFALPNLSVRIGMLAAFTGLNAEPVYRKP